MNSQFFKYSHRANPLILLFLGILGVIWGSTFFMGVLVCLGIVAAIIDTRLKADEVSMLKIGKKYLIIEIVQSAISQVLLAFFIVILFWAFGFWICLLWATCKTIKHLYVFRKDLKVNLLSNSKLP